MPYCPSQLVSWFYDICNQDHPNQYSLFLISFLGNNGLMKDIISNYRSLAFEVGKSVFRPFQNPEDTWPISSTGQGCFTFIPFSAILPMPGLSSKPRFTQLLVLKAFSKVSLLHSPKQRRFSASMPFMYISCIFFSCL